MAEQIIILLISMWAGRSRSRERFSITTAYRSGRDLAANLLPREMNLQ